MKQMGTQQKMTLNKRNDTSYNFINGKEKCPKNVKQGKRQAESSVCSPDKNNNNNLSLGENLNISK